MSNQNTDFNFDTNDNRMKKGFLQATNYLNSHLNPGEIALYRAHLSWIPIFIHQIPFMLVGGIIGGLVWGITNDFLIGSAIFIIAGIIGVLSQIPQCYKNIATDILITSQGVHSKTKLIAVEDDQFTGYGYINDAELNYHSIIQRFLQYGEVKISTVSGTEDDYVFKNLAKPMTFKRACRAAQQRFLNRGLTTGGPMMNAMPPQQIPQQNMNGQIQVQQNMQQSPAQTQQQPQQLSTGIPTRHRR